MQFSLTPSFYQDGNWGPQALVTSMSWLWTCQLGLSSGILNLWVAHFSPTSMSHQQVSLMHILAVTVRAVTSVPGTHRSSQKPGQDWRQEASVGVVLSSRLDGSGESFYKVWFSCSGFNLLPYFPIEIVSHDFWKAFQALSRSLLSPPVFPHSPHTLPFVSMCVVGRC